MEVLVNLFWLRREVSGDFFFVQGGWAADWLKRDGFRVFVVALIFYLKIISHMYMAGGSLI
jgi:hypothetical protein